MTRFASSAARMSARLDSTIEKDTDDSCDAGGGDVAVDACGVASSRSVDASVNAAATSAPSARDARVDGRMTRIIVQPSHAARSAVTPDTCVGLPLVIPKSG
ncbi:MAG: hypothetical protein QM736_13230 [Vicinamibacterales bacterium]